MDRLLIWDIEVARLTVVLRAIQSRQAATGLLGYLSTTPNTAETLTREVWDRFIERVRRGEL